MNYLFVAILVSALCTLSSVATLELELLPTDKEWIYQYEATVLVDISQPGEFASVYKFIGDLHIQMGEKNSLNVYLTDLKYSLYNGRETLDRLINNQTLGLGPFIDVPTEFESLKIPFNIDFSETGKILQVSLDHADKEFSMNIKKSIASTLQGDFEILNNYDGKTSIKTVHEDTIYGLCDVKYYMYPQKSGAVGLTKTFEPEKCENQLDLKRDRNIMTSVNSGTYRFEKSRENRYHLTKIRTDSQIEMYPQGGVDGVRFAKTLQLFTFKQEVPKPKEILIENPQTLKSLKYVEPLVKCRELPLNSLFDVTGGRRPQPNPEKLVHSVDELLTELNNYLKENHINFEQPATKNVKLVYRLLTLLESAHLEVLQQIFNLLHEKSASDPNENDKLYLYVQLLPHVGTKASAILVRNLIRKQKIDSSLAMMILKDLSAHVRCPSEKLLIELEDMLSLHEANSSLHNALVLTFASLVRRTFENFDEKSPLLEKYITQLVTKLNSSPDHPTRVQYLQALANIGIGSVLQQLTPIVNGDTKVDDRLRGLALQAIAPQLTKNFTLMDTIVMPILADRDLNTALRVTAYNIYINTNPSYESFLRLHLLLASDSNQRLYTFHYNTLKSLSRLGASSFEGIKGELARIILRFAQPPINERQIDGTYIYEYIDPDNGFGAQLHHTLVDNEKEIILQSRILTRINNYNYEMCNVFLRLIRKHEGRNQFGVTDPVSDEIRQANPLFAFNFPFELIIQRGGRTISTQSVDIVTLDVVRNILRNFDILMGNQLNFLPVLNIPFRYERVIPNAIGVPIVLIKNVPIIQSLKFDFSSGDKLNINFRLAILGSRDLDLRVYNPINDLYHGLISFKSMALNVPLNLEVSVAPDRVVTVIFKKNSHTDSTGLQMYATTKIYVDGPNVEEILGKFGNGAKVIETVAGAGEYKKRVPVTDTTFNGVGKRVEAAFFNCERNVSRGTLITDLLRAESLYGDTEFSLWLEWTVLQQYLMLTPGVETCAFNIQFHDLPNVDHVELRVHGGYVNLKSVLGFDPYPTESSMGTNITLTAKAANSSHIVKQTFMLETDFMVENRRNLDNFSAHFTYTREEKSFLKTKIFAHFDHRKHGNQYASKIKFDVGNEKSVMDINIGIMLSDEQKRVAKQQNFNYPQCRQHVYQSSVILPYSQRCARVASSLNKYSVDIQVNNDKVKLVSLFLRALRTLRSKYYVYRQPINHVTQMQNQKQYHIDLVLPILRDEVDVQMKIGNVTETYVGIPHKHDYTFFGLLQPYFTMWSLESLAYETIVIANFRHCLVNAKYTLTDQYKLLDTPVPKEYTSVLKASDTAGDAVYTFSVRSLDETGSLGLKIESANHTLEIAPKVDGYVINGDAITPEMGAVSLEFDDKQYFAIVTPYPKLFVIESVDYDFVITSDDKTLRFDVPHAMVDRLEGTCME